MLAIVSYNIKKEGEMMNLYDFVMYPLEKLILSKIRKEIMSEANGKCLEIAFGTGVNMKYYNFTKIDEFHAIDIYKDEKSFPHVTYHLQSAESLPFADKSFDTIIVSLALCSIENADKVLGEIFRCLKDDGSYIFLEHVQAKSKIARFIFNSINTLWRKMAGGCQINLNTVDLMSKNGFSLKTKSYGVFRYGIAKKSIEE